MTMRDLIFISYHHRDRAWLDRLEVHLIPLLRERTLSAWSDTRLQAGAVLEEEIALALARARVAVVLISPDYLASDALFKELSRLLEGAALDGVKLLGLPVRPAAYDASGLLAYEPLRDPEKPLSLLKGGQIDKALVAVAKKILAVAAPPAEKAVPPSAGKGLGWDRFLQVAYLSQQCQELGVSGLEQELRQCLLEAPAEWHGILCVLERGIRQESHWLRSQAKHLGALLYNRLLSNKQGDEQRLQFPEGRVPLLRLRISTSLDRGEQRTLEGHALEVTACVLSRDGKRVVSASADRTLKVWDVESGQALKTLEGHASEVTACVLSGDGRRLVSASADRTLKVWDVESGQALKTLEGHTSEVTACVLSGDGRRLVSASADQSLKVWDIETGELLKTLEGHDQTITACALSGNGRRLVSASQDKTLKVWDIETGELLKTLESHVWDVTACALSADGSRLVSASQDKTLKVWDTDSGAVLRTLRGHALAVTACALSADGKQLASASGDRSLRLWDIESGKLLKTLAGHSDWVMACALSADGRWLVSGSRDRSLKVWDIMREGAPTPPEGHEDGVTAFTLSKDGRRLISGSRDKSLKVWDVESGKVLASLEGHALGVTSCALSRDGRWLVSGADSPALKVWDIDRGEILRTLEGHADGVMACALSADGRRLVSGSKDKTLKVWDIDRGEILRTLEGHADGVMACALSADGRRLVSGSKDKTLKVWDVDQGEVLRTLEGHADGVMACALSADGRRLVSGSKDKTLKVWDVERGEVLRTLEGHVDGVMACALSADGRRLVSGSKDKTLKVWDVDTGQCQATVWGVSDFLSVCVDRHLLFGGDALGNVWCLQFVPDAVMPTVEAQHINAKVVLVGESGAGKSGLGIRLAENVHYPTDSTHGARFWQIPVSAATVPGPVRAEVTLWDFAGQDYYHLIHQLFLDHTDAALLVFDGSRHAAFDGLSYWARVLQKQAPKALKYLVAARCDTSPLRTDATETQRFLGEHGLMQPLFVTSAKVDQGINALWQRLCMDLPWDRLQRTTEPRLFRAIKELLLERKREGDTMLLRREIVRELPRRFLDREAREDEIDAGIDLLQNQGVAAAPNPQHSAGKRGSSALWVSG